MPQYFALINLNWNIQIWRNQLPAEILYPYYYPWSGWWYSGECGAVFFSNGRCQPDVLLFKTQEITPRCDRRLWGLRVCVCIYGVMFNDPPLVSVIIDPDCGDSQDTRRGVNIEMLQVAPVTLLASTLCNDFLLQLKLASKMYLCVWMCDIRFIIVSMNRRDTFQLSFSLFTWIFYQ